MKKLFAPLFALIAAFGLVGAFATTALADTSIFVAGINAEVTAPEDGKNPDYAWSATAMPYWANPVVACGTESITWKEQVGGAMLDMRPTDTFEAGHLYACEIAFQVPETHSLSIETVLKVNGTLVKNDETGVDPATKTVRIYREWQLDSTTPPQFKHIDQVNFTFPDLKAGDRLYESGWTCETNPVDVLTVTDCAWYRLVDPAKGTWEPARGYAKAGETYGVRLEAVAFNEYRGDKDTKILIDGGSAFFTDSRIVGATHVIATCQWALAASPEGGDEPVVTPESDAPGTGSSVPATGDSSLPIALAALAFFGASGVAFALQRKRA